VWLKWSGKELRKIGIMGLSGFKKRIEEKTAEEWFELGLEEKDPKKKIEYYSKCLELDLKDELHGTTKDMPFMIWEDTRKR